MITGLKFNVGCFRLEEFPGYNRISAVLPNLKPQTSNLKPSGFTLIEIVLAIGIMSFALVGILGLFPVALETARDSKAETQVALLARQIESDLLASQAWNMSTGSGGVQTLNWSARLFNSNSASYANDIAKYNTLGITATLPAGSATTATTYLAFANNTNQELLPLGTTLSATQFDNGVSGADYLARIEATYNHPDHPGLVQILITLSSPGNAPAAARRSNEFFTLMGQR